MPAHARYIVFFFSEERKSAAIKYVLFVTKRVFFFFCFTTGKREWRNYQCKLPVENSARARAHVRVPSKVSYNRSFDGASLDRTNSERDLLKKCQTPDIQLQRHTNGRAMSTLTTAHRERTTRKRRFVHGRWSNTPRPRAIKALPFPRPGCESTGLLSLFVG